jgi:hypothetical protein
MSRLGGATVVVAVLVPGGESSNVRHMGVIYIDPLQPPLIGVLIVRRVHEYLGEAAAAPGNMNCWNTKKKPVG